MEKGSGGLGSIACETMAGSWLVASVVVLCITAGFDSGVEAAGVAALEAGEDAPAGATSARGAQSSPPRGDGGRATGEARLSTEGEATGG
jgi:hypothetical protein